MSYFKRKQQQNYYRQWQVENPKALVFIAHGLCEHSGRYTPLAEYLNQQGYSVYALDHRGHGKSDGQLGHITDFSEVSADLHHFIEMIKAKNPNQEAHLLGHSMGGLIATSYAIRYDNIRSLMVSSPAYEVKKFKNKVEMQMARLLSKISPSFSLSNGLDATRICRDDKVVQAYVDDPLVHDQVSLGFGGSFYKEQRFVRKHLEKIVIPSLMLIAESDDLTEPKAAHQYFAKLTSQNNKLCSYPDAYHEVLNEEIEGPQAFKEIKDWLQHFSD